jgi:hypothetical protein
MKKHSEKSQATSGSSSSLEVSPTFLITSNIRIIIKFRGIPYILEFGTLQLKLPHLPTSENDATIHSGSNNRTEPHD